MKGKDKIGNYSDKEWKKLASLLSGEEENDKDLLGRFMADDGHNTVNYWKELNEMKSEKEIDVDKAWNKLFSRLDEDGLITVRTLEKVSIIRSTWFRIAASLLILLSVGSGLVVLERKGLLSPKTLVATSDNEKNLEVTLPDGSNVVLNRNTKLSFRKNFGRHKRNVYLTGEAYFDIIHDAKNPFTVDAGAAKVKVLGTSFNVITDNQDSAVEVYVTTGRVMMSDNSGNEKLEVEPGYIGTVGNKGADKVLNSNPNYLSWNTGHLVYNGQTLDIVFSDLKRVYNMDIVADSPDILQKTWTSPIDNQPQETIIRLICVSFNLGYLKDGSVYHLYEK
jgi:ferric-dicitrate binding protein FerR (iron transport regulator)